MISTTQRIELRAIERCMSMSDAACFKIAHVMFVKGHVQEFLRCAPEALMLTFNRHPKMRARQVKNDFAVAEIHPQLTLQDITRLSLLQVKETDADGISGAQWHAYVQGQVNIPFDRYNEFPFCLHVWVDSANDQARLFLFSDHYLSDGSSGNTVLNDVLTFASSLSLKLESATAAPVEELPVRESLYSFMLAGRPCLGAMLRLLIKVGAKALLKSAPMFVPVITPRSNQRDFGIPAPNNSSTMLFANGATENLAKLQARCKEEGTTFFGAMTAAIFTGYAHAITSESTDRQLLKMRLHANFNMRERVSVPIEPESVGSYATATPMEKLSNESVDIATKRFWDLARQAKHESTEIAQSFASLALPMVLLDQHFTSQSSPAFFDGVTTPYASVGDVNVSSVGRYPYLTSHAFHKTSARSRDAAMRVESVHYNCRTPFLAPSSQFYFTSVHAVGYSFNHHYDEQSGKKLFEAVVAVMESVGEIGAHETLANVLHRVTKSREVNSLVADVA